jgi:FMN reductase
MDQMRTAVRQCYGWSLPYGVSIHGENDFGAGETPTNPRVGRRLRMLGRDVVVYGSLLREGFLRDMQSDDPETFVARYRK